MLLRSRLDHEQNASSKTNYGFQIGLRLGLGALLFFSVTAFGEERVVLSNSVKPLPASAAPRVLLTPAGAVAAEASVTMEFMLALKMRDMGGLQARIAAGQVCTPAEMAEKYYPLEADYKAVVDWLTAQGFTITQTDPNRLGVFASGPVSLVQQALQVSFAQVTVGEKTYTSAATAPSLPVSLASAVQGINGLQPHIFGRVHSHVVKPQNGYTHYNVAPFYPAEIVTAYGGGSLGVTGAGQTIGIVIDTPPLTSDLTAFWAETGVTQSLTNISFVQVVAGTNAAPSGEESLDTEWASGVAPNAKVRVYVTTDLSFINIDKAYQNIISDLPSNPGLKQVSLSYGANETEMSGAQMDADAAYFASMAVAGVSVFVSTGDSGSSPNGVLQVSSPSNDPSVTAVGGTSIATDNNNVVTSESVWTGSGGGTSAYFSRPAWQTGSGVSAGVFRLNPDVSAPADPNTGALVYLGGLRYQFGGTSWSAPAWAGFCALLNEARSNAGMSSAGLLGPKIYPLIGTSSFRDITVGNNGVYSATAGFDLCTGIGVPNLANLISVLSTYTVSGTVTVGGNPLSSVLISDGTRTTSTDTSGNYVIFGVSQGSYTLTPTLTGYSFAPAVLPITVSTSNLTGQNFVGTLIGSNTAPTISAIAEQSINIHTATGAIAFTVADAETAVAALTVNGTSSNTMLVPNANIVLDGSGANRTVTVTPVVGQSGTSTITLTVSDGSLTASSVFVLTVIPNTPPMANDQSVSGLKNSAISITLTASDVDSNPLTYGVVTLPAYGTLSGTAPNLSYTPAAEYAGIDSFTFRVNDGIANSNIATVSIKISGRTPVLSSLSVTPNPVLLSAPVTFTAVATDPDGDDLTYAWNFGDGETGTGAGSEPHTYATAGTFTAIVTASDINGLSVSGSVDVVVSVGEGSGFGVDSDKDGVSDANELLDGSNPLDATSFKKVDMTVSSLFAKLNFSKKGKDTCNVTAIIPNFPVSYDLINTVLKINVGGATASYILDDKGRANTAAGTVQLSLPKLSRKSKTTVVPATVKILMKNDTWASTWADEGIDSAVTVKNKDVAFIVDIALAGHVYTDRVPVKASTTAKVSGSFKK